MHNPKDAPPPYGPTVPPYVPTMPSYPPYQSAPQQNVTVTALPQPLGPGPSPALCTSCHAQITTRTSLEASTKTHLFALILCLINNIQRRLLKTAASSRPNPPAGNSSPK